MRGVQPVGGIRRYRELQLLLHVRVLSAHPRVARSCAKGRATALHGNCTRVRICGNQRGARCSARRLQPFKKAPGSRRYFPCCLLIFSKSDFFYQKASLRKKNQKVSLRYRHINVSDLPFDHIWPEGISEK